MFRAAVRTAPRALRQRPAASAMGRRFASTAPADKRYTWKGTAARLTLAYLAFYWYSNSSVFADDLSSQLSDEPPHFSESDLPTVDAIVEEKRKVLDARLKAKEEQAAKDKAASSSPPPPPPPRNDDPTAAAVATAEDAEKSPEQLEQEAGQQGAFNPETGEINWDCPCLGGMAHGPCGEEFKAAFSCFVYSTVEIKGMDCVDKFQHMQDCFRKYPDIYGEEIADEEAAEREAEDAAAGSPVAGGNEGLSKAPARDSAPAASTSPKSEKPETPAKEEKKKSSLAPSEDGAPAASTPSKSEKPETSAKKEEKKSSLAPSEDQKAHDATATKRKAAEVKAPKSAASAVPAAALDEEESKEDVVDGQRGIPKKSFDATSASETK